MTKKTLHSDSSLSRRTLLSIGGLSTLGLTLPRLLNADQATRQSTTDQAKPASPAGPSLVPKAKSCILFFMEGGPSHIDLWDMKPYAPAQIRGIYDPIATSLPGFQLAEKLPQLARVAHHLTVVRSVTHTFVDHNASSYYMLTGQVPLKESQLIRGPSGDNAPPYGSVLAKLRPTSQPLPDYVHLPKRMFNCGNFIPGVLSGFLGDRYDPLIAGDPSQPSFEVPGLEQRFSQEHFDRRRALLSNLDQSLARIGDSAALDRMDTFYRRAFSLITAPAARKAFRIEDEPDSVRQRYGMGKRIEDVRGRGLPHLGQSMLLARRLIEAGVRMVTVWAGGQAFDGHTNHFNALTQALCPPTDQALSALIEDLHERGLLDETLVVALCEFGRTPKLGQITSSAGATPDGRDHWPNAYTILLAGAGVKAGTVFGATDDMGAYPTEDPVGPVDVAATIYTLMGLDPHSRIYDRLNRPHHLANGQPIQGVMA